LVLKKLNLTQQTTYAAEDITTQNKDKN